MWKAWRQSLPSTALESRHTDKGRTSGGCLQDSAWFTFLGGGVQVLVVVVFLLK